MLPVSAPAGGLSLTLLEVGLTAIAATLAFALPEFCSRPFRGMERAFGKLAHKPRLAVTVVGVSALLLRLALLPAFPIPLPFIPDDFSFLLAADTFAHGRLANPTPAMWTHFETLHITMQPTYMTMYFPAQGLFLAAGKVLLGNAWMGVLAATVLMCAAICWMLQAWLPPGWALLGGFLAVLRLGLFSYWINTYTGAGSIAALGGALMLGAMPRLIKTPRMRYALFLAVGIVLVAFTRPYEGVLLCLPVALMLARWIFTAENRPSPSVLLRIAALPLLVLVAAAAWMGYYDYRAFGSPATLPYTVDRATYAVAPYYVWQSRRAAPVYRHESLKRFYLNFEPQEGDKVRSLKGYFIEAWIKIHDATLFFAGAALLPPLFLLRRVLLDRRIRFLVLCVAILIAGMAIEIYLIPHYVAPFTAAFYAIGLQAMRHLRVWKFEGQSVGRAMVRFLVAVCIAGAGLRTASAPLHIGPAEWPPSEWVWAWYGPGYFGVERAQMQATLESRPAKQLVIVRYTPDHYPLNEWVYNAADIDGSKVIWAREMDEANNRQLIDYYKDREVWLVQPDAGPPQLSPYPLPPKVTSTVH